MSELGPSSFDRPHSMDSPGRNADTPFGNQELYGGTDHLGRKSEPSPPKGWYDEGDISYDDLPDYGAEYPGDVDYPDVDVERPESTTPEVQRSINQIEATEAVIANHTGETGQELADSTAEFLASHAEDSVKIDASNREDVVETALIEGALEVSKQRPEATDNPIIKLEKDGYDEQVVDGIKKLHEEGATLPNGESAAEVVARVVDDYDNEKRAVSNTEISEELDTAIQYYVNGASKEYVEEHTGINPSALTKHIRGLPTEESDYLKEMRQKSLDGSEATETPTLNEVNEVEKDDSWRNSVDPRVLALATNPDAIDPADKREALDKANRISGGERVILYDNDGQPRWGEELSEPGQVFSFEGNIRGNFDSASEDTEELRKQRMDIHIATGALRGRVTHVIVETEDGQQLMIRRTNETNSAKDQLFDVASTAKAGTDSERRSLDSSTLKHVVAVVGEPLMLGIDPKTGKHIKTKSPITKITTLDMRKDPIDPNHPRLTKPEFSRNTIGEFGEAMQSARNQSTDKDPATEAVNKTVEAQPN